MNFLDQLALIAQILAAIKAAQQGKIDTDIKGIRYKRETWDLHLTGTRRP